MLLEGDLSVSVSYMAGMIEVDGSAGLLEFEALATMGGNRAHTFLVE